MNQSARAMAADDNPASGAVTSMPNSPKPKPPRPLLTCPQCSKQFGKQTKLDSHLLEHHDATLRLSPGVLSPPRSPTESQDAVRSVLTAALDEANRVFELPGPPKCSVCPRSRTFRNKRDLAQHFVSKHSDCLAMGGDVAVSVMPVVTKSETSVNPLTRNIGDAGTAVKRVKFEKEEMKVAKKEVKVAIKGLKAEVKLTPVKTIAKATGSKPPVTPKRSQKTKTVVAPKTSAMRKAAASKVGETAPVAAATTTSPLASHIPVMRAVTTAPMDFSCVGGFATNARKSYYRLSNR